MNLFTYDEDGQKTVLVAEGVNPVWYCNDGYYHICDDCNAEYYVNEDGNLFYNKDGEVKWKVKDIGDEECIYERIEALY